MSLSLRSYPLQCALVSVVLVSITFYRAATLPFIHDESLSFLLFMEEDLADVLTLNTPGLFPNNHILNTLGMRAANGLFGPGELYLRLASAMSLPLFLLFAYLICSRYAAGVWRTVVFLLLVLNPYLVEFFCLARGYGMASAFLLGGLWFAMRTQDGEHRCIPAALACASLAALAHLTFLVPAALLVATTIIRLPSPAQGARVWLASAAVLAAGAAALLAPLRRMLALSGWTAEQGSFWNDTVLSLVQQWQGDAAWSSEAGNVVSALIALWAVVAATYTVVALLRQRIAALADSVALTTLLIFGCSAISWLQFHLLGTPYLSARFATFYLPLFTLSFGFVIDRVTRPAPAPVARWTAAVIAGMLLFHTWNTLNFTYVREGRAEGGVWQALAVLEAHWREHGSKRPATVWLADIYRPSIDYYRRTRQLDWLAPVVHADGKQAYDYRLTVMNGTPIQEPHTLLADGVTGTLLVAHASKSP